MKKKSFFHFLYVGLLLISIIFIQYCGGFSPTQTDYLSAPDPYDTTATNLEPVILPTGVYYYIVRPGTRNFVLSPIDSQSDLYYTFRARSPSGELTIFFSSYADGNTSAIKVNINTLAPLTVAMREAFYGMKENEQRTIIVKPENAYANAVENSTYYDYRNSDIIIDVEVSKLSYNLTICNTCIN